MKLDHAINTLGTFCGERDISKLTTNELQETYSFPQADVIAFFGGSILAGADEFAKALQENIAKIAVIVGGAGHTTETLREQVNQLYPQIKTANQTEAEIFSSYLAEKYQLQVELLETKSTNCGNNVTNLLALLHERKIDFSSLILMQDATMQRRMGATMQKYLSTDQTIINFASYQATVYERNGKLNFEEDLIGMWTPERYVSLLLGEIPRLRNDANGYGPNGKNYLAAIKIPAEIEAAFQIVQQAFPHLVRKANPKFQSS